MTTKAAQSKLKAADMTICRKCKHCKPSDRHVRWVLAKCVHPSLKAEGRIDPVTGNRIYDCLEWGNRRPIDKHPACEQINVIGQCALWEAAKYAKKGQNK